MRITANVKISYSEIINLCVITCEMFHSLLNFTHFRFRKHCRSFIMSALLFWLLNSEQKLNYIFQLIIFAIHFFSNIIPINFLYVFQFHCLKILLLQFSRIFFLRKFYANKLYKNFIYNRNNITILYIKIH